MSGYSTYYVDAASVTPDEPLPGIYFAHGNRSHGPFGTRQEAHEAWTRLRNQPPPPADEDRWAWNHFDPEPGETGEVA
jgi:hypothetical protein